MMDTVLVKELAGQIAELCRDPQIAPLVLAEVERYVHDIGHCVHVNPRFRNSHDELAPAITQVVVQNAYLVYASSDLADDIQAGNAKINRAFCDLVHNVVNALEQHVYAWKARNGCRVLARVGLDHAQVAGFEEIQRWFRDSAFTRQRKGYASLIHVRLCLYPG